MFTTISSNLYKICAAALFASFSSLTVAQPIAQNDFVYSFDSPESVDAWELSYSSETATEANLHFNNGTLAFLPDWHEPEEYLGYTTDLGGSFDFTNATIFADVLFSAVYYPTYEGESQFYLAGSAIILFDTAGRGASVQFWGPWGGEPDTFTTHQYMNGEASLDYIEAGFDITQVQKIGVNIHSLGALPSSTGLISYDNILIDLDGAAAGNNPANFATVPLEFMRWSFNVGGASSGYSDDSGAYFSLYYRQQRFNRRADEYLSHKFLWNLNLRNARLAFDLLLPEDFAGNLLGLRLELQDGRGRVAVLSDMDANSLVFGQPMRFDIRRINPRRFVSAEAGFNLADVDQMVIQLPTIDAPFVVNGDLNIEGIRLWVDSNLPKNQENSRLAPRLSTRDMSIGLYFDEWQEEYESAYTYEWRDKSILLSPYWQDIERLLDVGVYWWDAVNLKNTLVRQRVYVPAEAIGSGMDLSLELRDTYWNTVNLEIAVLDDAATAGWVTLEFNTADIEGDIDLSLIANIGVNLNRNEALGPVGEFRVQPPVFVYQ